VEANKGKRGQISPSKNQQARQGQPSCQVHKGAEARKLTKVLPQKMLETKTQEVQQVQQVSIPDILRSDRLDTKLDFTRAKTGQSRPLNKGFIEKSTEVNQDSQEYQADLKLGADRMRRHEDDANRYRF
jgi:hypothetical protein